MLGDCCQLRSDSLRTRCHVYRVCHFLRKSEEGKFQLPAVSPARAVTFADISVVFTKVICPVCDICCRYTPKGGFWLLVPKVWAKKVEFLIQFQYTIMPFMPQTLYKHLADFATLWHTRSYCMDTVAPTFDPESVWRALQATPSLALRA